MFACLFGLVTACGEPTTAPPAKSGADSVVEPAKSVAPPALSAAALRGEALVAEYGCTACHAASPERAARLAAAPAPNLEHVGSRRTASGLAAQIQDPRPDAAGNFACGARASAAEARALATWLTRDERVSTLPVEVLPHEVEAGRVLFDQIGCRGCHSGGDAKGGLDAEALARNYSLDSLGGFLAAPLAAWPSGRHPDFGLNADQARRLATFVLAGDRVTFTRASGLRYEYYEAEDFPGDEPDWDSMEAVATGQTDAIGLGVTQRVDQFGLRLTGLVQLPVSGEYTFHLASDDGSYLDLAGERKIDHGGLHGNFPRTEKLQLEAGLTPIQLSMFERTGDEVLQLEFEVAAPEGGAEPIERREFTPEELFFDRAEYAPLTADLDALAQAVPELDGAALYVERGCLACHGPAEGAAAKPQPAAPLANLSAGTGCLAPTPPPTTPHFAFHETGRAASAAELTELAAYLAAPARPTGELAPATFVTRELQRLGCTGCHERGGSGGPVAAARPYFGQNYDGDDLGDEGRIPPTLTDAGAKLRRDWIETVVAQGSHGGAGVRPYMRAQMPAFPPATAARLAAAFEAVDLGNTTDVAPEFSEAAMEVGRELVGTAGFSCITCHDVAGKPSLGIPMIDLSNTPLRLRHGWFREWLEHPTEIRPGTRMASFWTNGRSARTDLLGGEADAQIDALWTYLSLGSGLPLPEGLVIDPGTYDLEPTDLPIYHACFWRGGSARGLAIGFPARKHLAFDQEHLRLDKLWYGAFVNAADTWDGRAGGLVSPAGEGILNLPSGLVIARLDPEDAAWPQADRRADGWRYLGHRRGANETPTFRYAQGDLVVEETLRPVFGPGGHFTRHFTVLGAAPGEWTLRLATGAQIEPEFGAFRITGPDLVVGRPEAELRVVFPNLDSDTASVRAVDGGFELLFPVTPDAAGRFELEVELQW